MSDVQYETFQHYGTNAQRVAFTPSPAAGIQPVYVWYETDTGKTFLYDTSWHQIASTSGGSLPTVAQGDLLYGSAANTLSALTKDANATRYLSNTGASNNPAWAQVNLADGVTGDLPYANLTQGSALSVLGVTGNATADVASIAAATDNQVLRRSGASVAFGAVNLASSDAVTGTLPVANGGTGVASALYVLRSASVQLTNAQIKALPTTPITIVAAPGAGFRIKPVSVTWQLSMTVATYTNVDTTYCALSMSMTDNAGAWVASPLVNDTSTTPDMTQVSDLFGTIGDYCVDILLPYVTTQQGDQYTPNVNLSNNFAALNNKSLVIAADNNGSGDFTGGDASQYLNVIVGYYVEAIP